MSGPVESKSEAALLGEIEALLARRRRGLAFPGGLERRFEDDTGANYGRVMSRDLLRTLVFYNLFILGDFLLTPDTLGLAAALHFLVVTPAILAVAVFYRRPVRPLARDIAGAVAPFLVNAQIIGVAMASAAPGVSHYLHFVALNVATVNSAMRLRHRAAAWSCVATLAALAGALALSHKATPAVAVTLLFSTSVTGAVTLRGKADREREFRRAYLHGLRDRLRIAASDAEANHDALTGLANRRGLDLAVRATWDHARAGEAVAAILFDVDMFKAYNDIYGHLAGDACLRALAGAARERLAGRAAAFARYGGEEFLALLRGPAAEEAEAIAEQLRLAVLALKIANAGSPERAIVSASFGVARGRVGETGFEALTAAADAALYAAKAAGRNRVTRALAA